MNPEGWKTQAASSLLLAPFRVPLGQPTVAPAVLASLCGPTARLAVPLQR